LARLDGHIFWSLLFLFMKTSLVGLFLPLLALLAAPAYAVDRVLTIAAPAAAAPGSDVHVEVTASTTARDGEQIGFLQAEYSVDGGKTWVPVYAENQGKAVKQAVNFRVGASGSTASVRVRAAFRGGKAGDVDFAGKPIAWGESWGTWATPPARKADIPVRSN
jgi:hypothetical protein